MAEICPSSLAAPLEQHNLEQHNMDKSEDRTQLSISESREK